MVAVGRAHLGDGLAALAEHLLERPLRAQLAVREDDDVVDRLRDLGEQMARHEDRPALRGLVAEQLAEPADALRVEAVGRLVEDQHLRVAEQRGGDRQPLAHAHRVALHAPVRRVLQLHEVEQLVDAALRMPARRREHAQVVAARAPGMERRLLEQRADLAPGSSSSS